MKKSICCFVVFILLMMTACEKDIRTDADISDVVFEAEEATPAINGGGYPRFEKLHDGTLLLFNEGTLRRSTDNGESWHSMDISQNATKQALSSNGKIHSLSCENWQGFVMSDGTVMVSYRARTKNYEGGEFYTSIRAMISKDNARTFSNEVVITEATANSFNGFWEPFMIQPDDDTVLLFYSDDLNVTKSSRQQNIVYHEYSISEGIWGSAKVAINGVSRNSRDGMPVITKLSDGGYAMVIETQDYHHRFYGTTYGKSVFVISVSISADGRTWGEPVPVIAPEKITGGNRCAAPYITTLPDGRVVISYMTDDTFNGTKVSDEVLNCVYGAVISNSAITSDTKLKATSGGVAVGFTALPDVFDDPLNGYMVWNTVFCDGESIYFAGSAGANDGSVAPSLRIRRAYISK